MEKISIADSWSATGRMVRKYWQRSATGILALTFAISSAVPMMAQQTQQDDLDTDMGLFVPTDNPNAPMGIARGVHPGRVAWAYDPKAAAWDGKHGLYSDADNNSQTRVNDMMDGIIISLSTESDLAKAWQQLFSTFNEKKGKGYVGYKPGEKIAIKINLNDNGGSNIIDATPQSVLALLRQLVDVVGVPQEDITIYDAQRRGISAVYTYVEPLYPNVVYQNWGGFVPDVITYSSEITDPGARSLAKAAYDADYMINMALMKRHSQPTDKWRDGAGQTGITCTGKNQFGSIGNVPPLHFSIRDWSHKRGMATYNSIVDLMAHERIGENTLVYIVDAMYVNPKHNGKAIKFKRAPFNDGWTSSFLASNDPVAIESVVLDFIYSELPLAANADNFLHEAANIGNPPSGIKYQGGHLKSLGVHEHWNNPDDRQYSRNLGNGEGIELYRVKFDENRPAIETFYADRNYVDKNGQAVISWNTSNGDKVTLNGKKVDAVGNLTVKPSKTSTYRLEVTGKDGVKTSQDMVIRVIDGVSSYTPEEARTEGTFVLADGKLGLSGERSKARNIATWNVEVPASGLYLLKTVYTGTDPSPAYISVNGKQVTENYGWLISLGNTPREYYFPVYFEKGKNELSMEMPGRRGNKIHGISIVKELK